jgi:type II secretory pathway pseudopilin PulG
MIELLTVIAIIGILAAMLFPAIKGAITKAKETKARSAVAGLTTAFKAYYTEYGKWPASNENTSDITTNLFTNPRGIVFMEFPVKDLSGATVVDPWGQAYKVRFDATDYNNQIGDPFSAGTITAGVIVWSTGADKTANTKDDICSWK